MKLTELMSIEKWEALEKALNKRSSLNACVYDTGGFRITSFTAWANDLCPAIKSSPQGASAICALANQYVTSQSKETGQPVIIECDAGMVKFAIPIFWNNNFLGTAGGCGHRLPDSEVETFLIHKAIGRDLEELDAMAANVKTISNEEINEHIKFLQNELSSLLKDL
ncbi:MAG: PocR ligand-binding domain-containing protein [Thermodesulfobacteriota bacterium]|nr:PocR ligand-binding domain-containing protein [Thermodesulfobacteriota bacterium]